MKLTDVLLVTQNCRDQGEINFLSTVDEFITEYCADESPDIANALCQLISSARPYQWDGFFAAPGNKTFDMRLCQSQEDLLAFLGGKFNDSPEKMEERLPGTVGLHSSWVWYNNPELFTDGAVRSIKDHVLELGSSGRTFVRDLFATMPDFPAEKGVRKNKLLALSELIRQAESKKPFHGGLENSRPQRKTLDF